MANTAADTLIDTIRDWGVEVIFGLPGDGINGIMEALRKRQDTVRFIHVRHEEAAAFMACAYAKFTGKLGSEFSVEEGQAAARLCAINILAQLKDALGGDLDRVTGVIRLGGFVNAERDFKDHPKVINGASDLMVEVFGEAGRHARAAVGCYSLPRNVPVEIEAIFEVS